jgi:hypothetical protein
MIMIERRNSLVHKLEVPFFHFREGSHKVGHSPSAVAQARERGSQLLLLSPCLSLPLVSTLLRKHIARGKISEALRRKSDILEKECNVDGV